MPIDTQTAKGVTDIGGVYMSNKDIAMILDLYLKQNKINPSSKKALEAQYWFLAGIRSMTPKQDLPQIFSICMQAGRMITSLTY
jgi:hypothetical protein